MLSKNRIITTLWIIFPILAICVYGGSGYGQTGQTAATSKVKVPVNSILTAEEHPWGRFHPQSWACLQSITWTNHHDCRIANFRETRTTLQSVDTNGVTLQDVSTVDMAGKQVENAPVVRRFDFFQQPIQDNVQIRNAAPTKLVIDYQVVPCEVRIYEQSTPAGKRKTTVWYSTQIYPYVFRIENILRSLPSDKEPEERILDMTVTEVLGSSAFYLRRSKRGTYWLRTTQKSGNVTTITEATCSRYIPGGIIQKTTREFEGIGNEIKEIRTVETRLINYSYGTLPNDTFEPMSYTDESYSPYPLESIRPRWRRFYAIPPYSQPYPQ